MRPGQYGHNPGQYGHNPWIPDTPFPPPQSSLGGQNLASLSPAPAELPAAWQNPAPLSAGAGEGGSFAAALSGSAGHAHAKHCNKHPGLPCLLNIDHRASTRVP